MGEQTGPLKICQEPHERAAATCGVVPEGRSPGWKLYWGRVVSIPSRKIAGTVRAAQAPLGKKEHVLPKWRLKTSAEWTGSLEGRS